MNQKTIKLLKKAATKIGNQTFVPSVKYWHWMTPCKRGEMRRELKARLAEV
jgi:hypothetical protein